MKLTIKKIVLPLLSLVAVMGLSPMQAQNRFKDAGMVDRHQAGSQYLAYPRPAYGMPELSKAPKGYVPFHIEHYGRHGSRWLMRDEQYEKPVKYLEKADKAGKLTERGKLLLSQLKQIQEASQGRVGELTPLGHRQHRDIASRMVHNYPEIFKKGTHVDAKSTVIIRCILSMANEIAEIEKLVPGIITTMDASRTTQKILSYNSTDTVAKKLGNKADEKYVDHGYKKKHSDRSAFFSKIFNDQKYVADSLNGNKIFSAIFDVAVNTQSHDDQPDLYDVFTPEELHDEWLVRNASWYVSAGNTSLTKNRVPYNQRVLLRNIIESADTAMVSKNISANLRFGHESILLPLSILMEINDNHIDLDNLDNLESHWRNYMIFPMASNIQIIFYRPEKNASYNPEEVLVKVLLNEEDVKLPVKPVKGSYYRWTDLRNYYITKLDSFQTRFKK